MPVELQGPVRVRFAPSPTGYLHVGGARTAIYNELLRRRLGGVNILRIEDTDKQRSDEAMTRQIIDALEWLGVEIDEGPFLQSERLERHRGEALRLLAEEKAYHCFRTPEELDARRQEILGRGDSYRYKTAFGVPTRDEAERRIEAGEPYAIRLKVPDEEIVVRDLVRGDVPFPAEAQDDFIILRSDGTPTYHLSVCVDDVDMGVTHVVRGEDHLSNTPKHIALFRALGAEVPAFGHLPLILGTDKKRLSKRTGATSVEEFRDQGILPRALYNYLALLGWSPGDDRELMSREEMIEAFSADRLLKSAAVFDPDKLAWISAQYMFHSDLSVIVEHLRPFLTEVGLGEAPEERLRELIEVHRLRAKTLRELAEQLVHYFQDGIDYDDELTSKFRRQAELPTLLEELSAGFATLDDYTVDATEQVLRDLATKHEVKAGFLIHPTRIAMSGSKTGPGVFDVVVAVGQEEGKRRMSAFVEYLKANPIETEAE
ncbi:MAG: glutamate--tRNA ligase [Thermoanaerobaculia bacterium]|nr:glutamate--tRNA ligase [Thermoanaerobaculia bacterium]